MLENGHGNSGGIAKPLLKESEGNFLPALGAQDALSRMRLGAHSGRGVLNGSLVDHSSGLAARLQSSERQCMCSGSRVRFDRTTWRPHRGHGPMK